MPTQKPKPKARRPAAKVKQLKQLKNRSPPAPGPAIAPQLAESSFRLGEPGEKDDLAEMLGEAAVQSMTGGAQAAEEFRDEELVEEKGGPFIETGPDTEFAYDFAEPLEGEPAPFPVVSAQP